MKVINLSGRRQHPPGLVYCGRAFGSFPASPLGNPCSARGMKCPVCSKIHYPHHGPVEQGPSVQCYRKWLFSRLKDNNRTILAFLHSLGPQSILGCWCVDLEDAFSGEEMCHTEVIAKAARYVKGPDWK